MSAYVYAIAYTYVSCKGISISTSITYMYMCIYTCMHMNMCICVHMYTCMYAHMHTYTKMYLRNNSQRRWNHVRKYKYETQYESKERK